MSAILDPIVPALPAAIPSAIPTAVNALANKIHPSFVINGEVLIPDWVVDHDSYRRWAHSAEFPERGRYSFIDGTIWVDLTMEEFFSHNLLKTEYTRVIANVVHDADGGYFGSDRNLWTNAEAGISTEPDAIFIDYATLQSGRVRLIKGVKRGFMEIEGSPNMTLEVISDSSIRKDTLILKDKCAKAGVEEYWLVDVRSAEPQFEIWRLHEGSYIRAENSDGWLQSVVFARSFKLEQSTDRLGNPRFQLLVR